MFTSVVSVGHPVTINFDGRAMTARQGETVAACLLREGVEAFRWTPVTGTPRLPYCMIGHCFDCMVEIEGQGSQQACLVCVTDGMRIRPQGGTVVVSGGF